MGKGGNSNSNKHVKRYSTSLVIRKMQIIKREFTAIRVTALEIIWYYPGKLETHIPCLHTCSLSQLGFPEKISTTENDSILPRMV